MTSSGGDLNAMAHRGARETNPGQGVAGSQPAFALVKKRQTAVEKNMPWGRRLSMPLGMFLIGLVVFALAYPVVIGALLMDQSVIAGVGNLGQALAHYRGFTQRGFRVAALIDEKIAGSVHDPHGYLGAHPVADGMQSGSTTQTMVARLLTAFYFGFFIFMPWWSRLGKTKPVPDRVTMHD